MIDETAAEIEAMQTHSSSEVAIKAARALAELSERDHATVEEFARDVQRNASALRRAQPSHATLAHVLGNIESEVAEGDHADVDAAKATLAESIEAAVEEVESSKEEAAANAAELLTDGETLLVHDYSSTAMSAIEQAVADGAEFDIYVKEARPRCLGRKSVRFLADLDGVDPTLIVDSAAGHVMDDVDRAFAGITCIVRDTLHNRVGTYPLAATAHHAGVPMTVAGSSMKIVEGGFVFENDFREPVEVLREPTEGFDVVNPNYDATPIELLDQIVTDEGVREP